jgi:4-hydroxy-2-oxoheptanedioate aldolase
MVSKMRVAGWLAIPNPLVAEAAGRAGFDWVGLDLQHGAWDLGSAIRGIQILDLLDVPVLVRIADDELQLIPHLLDQGAAGIVLAMVRGPESVSDAIDRARYQPRGRRSYGGQRYGMRKEPSDLSTICPAIYAMVESKVAIERLDQIAGVPGIGGIHVGPVDLGLDLGVRGGVTAPAFVGAIQTIVAKSHAARLPVTMHAVTPDRAAEIRELGFDEIVLTSDIGVLRRGFDAEISATRDGLGL